MRLDLDRRERDGWPNVARASELRHVGDAGLTPHGVMRVDLCLNGRAHARPPIRRALSQLQPFWKRSAARAGQEQWDALALLQLDDAAPTAARVVQETELWMLL